MARSPRGFSGNDIIAMRYLWVPAGEQPDPEALARLREPFRVAARLVRRPKPDLQPLGIEVADQSPQTSFTDGSFAPRGPGWSRFGSQVASGDRSLEAQRPTENPDGILASGLGPESVQYTTDLAALPVTPQYVGSNQECVALVRALTGAPPARTWSAGQPVRGNAIQPGTAIATFDVAGHYSSSTDGSSHAAIFISQDETGITVFDQWRGHPAKARHISFRGGHSLAVDDADQYHIVITL